MFNRNNKQPETKKRRDLSQYGLFNIGMDDPENMDNDDDDLGDSDLEAELAAITGGGGRNRQKPAKKAAVAVPQNELDQMVAASLRDIPSDEELSGDDDDPDLLNELSELTGEDASNVESFSPQNPVANEPLLDNVAKPAQDIFLPTTAIDTADLIKTRIGMYKAAEQNAKETGDNGKARRFGRGLKTLEGLLKQAQAGNPVNHDDIPPEVFLKSAQNQSDETETNAVSPASPVGPAKTPETPSASSQPSPSASSQPSPSAASAPSVTSSTPDSASMPVSPTSNVDETKINVLLARQREYKTAAITKKKEGDTVTALQYMKIIKIFDTVLAAALQGEAVDLSDMPPPPNELPKDVLATPAPSQVSGKEENEAQQGSEPAEPPKKAAEPPPPAPTSILEALVQRLEKYKSVEKEAKDEGNSSKARRFGRIVKQYEDAIKLYKAKKPVPFEELPVPPGFGPIPLEGNAPAAKPSASATPSTAPKATPKPAGEKTPSPARPPLQKQDSRISGNHSNTTVMSKTIDILLARQHEYKAAALAAKKAGEIEQAKEYLKTFKGIDNLLNVARSGLPVDLSTLPISPNQRATLEDTFAVVDDGPEEHGSEDLHDIYGRFEEQLQKQLTICRTTRDHHKALGDVAGMNRFENLALSVQKDLDLIKLAKRKKTTVPKFHYEQKTFNVVKCNTDIAETELEINVVRGIGYNVSNPKEIDTYVKFEFGFPSETPYKTKTQVVYNTDSPEYNERFIAPINTKSRLCQRVFKRGGIKFEVYAKGGFFRSDTFLGAATVKLQPLETTCEIHDSFDLMDGRKTVGGKLEIKIRLRNPILTKQVEQLTEKWLIIGS